VETAPTLQPSPVETRKRSTVSRRVRLAIGEIFDFAIENRFLYLKITLALGVLGSLILSRRLWISSSRFIPTIPIFDFLPAIPFPLDVVLFGALMLTLAAVIASTRPAIYAAAFVVLGVILVIWDQTRLQPWFYQYLLMFVALAFVRAKHTEIGKRAALNTCRVIVACVYFWSGVQKINYTFVHETFSFLTSFYNRFLPDWLATLPAWLKLIVPVFEIGVAFALLTRRFRNAAVVLAVAAHLMILVLFIPAGRNTVVWPWNVAMIAFVVLLFWRDGQSTAAEVLLNGRRFAHAMVLLVCGILPALSLVGVWDSYLSWAMYSGNTRLAEVRIEEPVRNQLPPGAQRVVTSRSSAYGLNLVRWSYAELNVPAYPEPRVFRRLAAELCVHAASPDDVVLTIHERPHLFDGTRPTQTMDCRELRSRND
jgi:hypothetical protein